MKIQTLADMVIPVASALRANTPLDYQSIPLQKFRSEAIEKADELIYEIGELIRDGDDTPTHIEQLYTELIELLSK